MNIKSVFPLLVVLASIAAQGVAWAQAPGRPGPGQVRPGTTAEWTPTPLQEVGFDQRLDEKLPLDTMFRDEHGNTVRLGDYFGEKPVILAFVYYDCPMLCTMVLNGLTTTLKVMNFEVGNEFDIVTVSFDPRETPELATAKKTTYVQRYNRPGAEEGWHFLTGDEESIRRLTDAAGFRYFYDERVGDFAHASGIILVTPDGRLSKYLYGVEYAPRDLRLGLIEAASGRIGNPVDQILLYCYEYDPTTGTYGLVIMRLIRLGGLLTVLGLGFFVVAMLMRDRVRAQPAT
jgi:protein SCO1